MPEEQWQISGGESALSGPDPRRREEEFFLFQREGLSLQIGGSVRGSTLQTILNTTVISLYRRLEN